MGRDRRAGTGIALALCFALALCAVAGPAAAAADGDAALNHKAPVHVLVIPVKHAGHLSEFASQGDPAAAARLLSAAAEIGTALGPSGYRVVMNEGVDAGQSVFHLHAHVLAGRPLGWPPG